MSTSTLIVLAVIAVVVLWVITALQRPRDHAAARQPGFRRYRRAIEPATGPHSQSRRDGEGLCRPRARHAREAVKAREAAATAQGPRAGGSRKSSGALRQLFALSEAYPDLKANANFQQLQAELGDLENKDRGVSGRVLQQWSAGIQYRDTEVPGRTVRVDARLCALIKFFRPRG